jgi:hypothetical protein
MLGPRRAPPEHTERREVNFSSSLEMGVTERGLFLVPMILFGLFHGPLLIPWGDIQAEPFIGTFGL